jgi:aspartyl-tRNA(Asn)/glutamyl-tRNA(Gln) amidotransferase subunit C
MSVDINALAKLSRLALSPEEAEKMQRDIDSILGYMEVINDVQLENDVAMSEHNTVLREDVNPTEPGTYTEAVMKLPADVKDNKVRVRRVLP